MGLETTESVYKRINLFPHFVLLKNSEKQVLCLRPLRQRAFLTGVFTHNSV